MSKQAKQAHINLKVGNIAKMTGLELTIDYNSSYGGWRLEEGSDYGGVSTSKFGDRRRTYQEFIDYLDTIVLGLVLAQQRVAA
jgi:hypothetical protein